MKHEATFIREDDTLIAFLASKLKSVFKPYDRIAVKLHMGEPGNRYFIAPEFARRIVSMLKSIDCNPYLFDSPVIYGSPRNNIEGYLRCASDHGYTKEAIGAPVVVSNRSVRVEGARMTYNLSSEPIEAEGVLILTHVKGHLACGMGGAIKNVGMGCAAKETKGAIHTGGEPVYREGCTRCGACVDNCPTKNIVLEGDRPRFGVTWCPGCSNCALVCPEKCISPRVGTFDELLAESAVLSHNRFKSSYAVNVLKNIAKLCDCVPDAGPIIVEDIGFVCADDMLSADIASLKMIRKTSQREDIFAEEGKRSPWKHINAAAHLMGRTSSVSVKEIS
jgi:uncharacterized protein